MSDGPRKPPVRDPGDDEVYVPPGPGERPLPPRLHLPVRPVAKVDQLLEAMRQQLDAVALASGNTLAMQRKMALQLDGLRNVFNDRLDVFHRELALLRSTVTGDHGPRIADMEKKITPKQAAIIGGRYGGVALVLALVARGAGKVWPEFAETIESVLGFFGL